MEKMFIYDNGELAEVQAKSFIFELAMEGYIVDNPVLLSNECLDLKDPEVKSVEEPLDSKHRIDVQIQYANDTTAVVELKNVPVDTKALKIKFRVENDTIWIIPIQKYCLGISGSFNLRHLQTKYLQVME